MPDRTPNELLSQRPTRSDFARAPSYRARRVLTVSVLLILIGAGLRWGLGLFMAAHPGAIPTIQADGAWKQRPDQPGGIDIPHQDVQVYQSLDTKPEDKAEIEHLLPPPETPEAPAPTAPSPPPPALDAPPPIQGSVISKQPPTETLDLPPPAPQPNAAPSPAQIAEAPLPPVAEAPAPSSAPVPPISAATEIKPVPQPPPAHLPTHNVKRIPNPAPTSQPMPQAATEATANAGAAGSRMVQLASVQDEATARETMEKLQARYASSLAGAKLHLAKADLGARGIYYRIQSQALPEDQAENICSSLKKLKAGCILVHP